MKVLVLSKSVGPVNFNETFMYISALRVHPQLKENLNVY